MKRKRLNEFDKINEFNLSIGSLDKDPVKIIFSFFEQEYFPMLMFVCKEWKNQIEKIYNHGLDYNLYNVFDFFVEKNQLNILKWLRENGCPWDEDAFKIAVENGNLEIIKWLKEENCPWNKHILNIALECGNKEIIIWLIENNSLI